MAKILDRQRLHHRIRNRIEELFVRRGLRKGDPVPTYRELSEKLRVSLVTVQRAMDDLTHAGVVEGWPGRGSFLRKDLLDRPPKLAQAGLIFYGSLQLFFSSAYLMEIFQGILLCAEGLGVDVHIFSIKSEGRISEQEIEESGVDGLLLLGVANDAYLAEVARGQLPLVALDYRTVAAPCDYVVADNEQAAARAVEHLAELGHRRIAYLDGFSTDTLQPGDPAIETSDVIERREGYLHAMQRLGLAEHAKVFGVPLGRADVGTAAVAQFIKKAPEPPTAVLAYDTGLARALFAALVSAGLRVPQDCSLAAVAGASDAQIGPLTCTCNRVRFSEMGQRGVELLAERRANGRPGEPLVTKIGSDFVLGNTSAPLRT